MMRTKKNETPSKTQVAFNIGITGHRSLPDMNLNLLHYQIGQVLNEIDKNVKHLICDIGLLHTDRPYKLRVISMLAEGSDQISAECALNLGYHLQCPLPLKREEYENDFASDESKNQFYRLLNQAESVFEIEASSKIRSRAYQDCGHVMLAHSDLLMAIWDGEDSGKVGGTSDIVEHARQQDIPVVWINSVSPHDIKLLYGENTQNDWHTEIAAVIKSILNPWHDNMQDQFMPQNYISENCAKLSRSSSLQEEIDTSVNGFYKKHYAKHFECADGLAKRYRNIYRSCVVLRQLLPFCASIGLALGFYAILFGGPNGAAPAAASVLNSVSIIGFLIQAICFLLIIVLSKLEQKYHWHQKFTDYRALGELLRHMEYLAPAGLVIKGLRLPAFNQHVNLSWVNWQFRAIVREAGLPSGVINEKRVRDIFSSLHNEMIEGQLRYHQANQHKMSGIAMRLEKFGITIYYVGIIVVALRVGVRILTTSTLLATLSDGQKGYISVFFNMLSMVIPLFSTLAFGISSQKGYARIGQLSSAMRQDLLNLSNRLSAVRAFDFNELKRLSQYAADLMLSEFSDWSTFVKSKLISDH